MHKAVCYVVGMVLVMGMLALIWPEVDGLVVLEGYEHGMALCQGGPDQYPGVVADEAHMWQRDGIFYVVNVGHMRDAEVGQLIRLAKSECAQYLE